MPYVAHSQSDDMASSPSPNNLHAISSSAESITSSTGYITRTQQKLYLQRQHFLADDSTSLNHPSNQKIITKMYEKVQREWKSITRLENPMLASLERVWNRAQAQGIKLPGIEESATGSQSRKGELFSEGTGATSQESSSNYLKPNIYPPNMAGTGMSRSGGRSSTQVSSPLRPKAV
jgi:hypothetical protein